MKRLLLFMLAIMLALSFVVTACAEQTIYVDGQDHDDEYDDDGNIVTPIYRADIAGALEAANSLATDDNSFAEVIIEITTGNLTLGDTITFDAEGSNYPNLTKVTITGTSTLRASGGARHFVLESPSTEVVLSGLTLRGSSGGGIRINGSTVTLDGLTFREIDARDNDEDADQNGGAISIFSGKVTFSGNTSFIANHAENGGAMYISSRDDVTINGTFLFEDNIAESNGGALYLAGSGASASSVHLVAVQPEVRASASSLVITIDPTPVAVPTFTGNTAANGGAIYIASSGNAVMTGPILFTGNTATGDGGAIYVDGGKITDSNSTLTFTDNHAGSSVYSSNTVDPTITALPTSGFGGAIYFTDKGTSSFGVTEFHNNDAPLGGAIYVNEGTVNFNNTTKFGTINGNAAYRGGAVFLNGGSTNFNSRTSFDKNLANDHGGALYAEQGGSETVNFTTAVSFTGNKANTDNGNLGDGGAIWWGLDASAAFVNAFNVAGGEVTFRNNSTGGTSTSLTAASEAGNGGAICLADTGTLIIDNKVDYEFSGNTAYNKGGAIYSNTAGITFKDVEVTAQNTATNTGGGLAASLNGKITVENSKISKQSAYAGGAIYAQDIEIQSSDMSDNSTTTGDGGAAYTYENGNILVNNSTFTGNSSANRGGAIYANASTATITESFFETNTAAQQGGAVFLDGACTTTITNVDMSTNRAQIGGAIRAFGTVTASYCYFNGNYAAKYGGAMFFDQSGAGDGIVKVSSSTFFGNVSGSGQGGALSLKGDKLTIDSCTFDSNSGSGGTDARGGAVYFDVSSTSLTETSTIVNSTFVRNSIESGTNTTRGGALAVKGNVKLTSCAFIRMNIANSTGKYRGGAVCVENGSGQVVTIEGTIIVGNSAQIGSDIWLSSTGALASGVGYNRIGICGVGDNNTGWSSIPGISPNDRENSSWSSATFYSDNDLDDNVIDGTRPPYIGSSRSKTGKIRLQTVMLNEADDLPEADRATNIIPYNGAARFAIPQFDQRGKDRWEPQSFIDCGPVMFEGTSDGNPEEPITTYTIKSIVMSGIPNTLKSVGQTASLIAIIRYTNGRTAYGGSASGCEPVKWSSSAPGIVWIDTELGNIVAKAAGQATITVTTTRTTAGGVQASASRVVRVESIPATYMNTVSQQYPNYFATYIEQIAEHDLSLSLADVSTSAVKASSFQRNFKAVWPVNKATLVTDLRSSTPTFTTASTYRTSDGLSGSKNAAVSINFQGRSTGDLFPLVYSWNFSGDEIKSLLGSDLTGQAVNANLAAKLFGALRIDYQTATRTYPVIGSGGVSASEAYQYGALALTKADADRGVHVELTAYLANVAATGSNDGPQIVKGAGSTRLLVVPDGADDGAITGTMWMAQKSSSSSTPGTNTNTNTNNGGNSSGGEGSGGGGGCSSLGLGLLGAVVLFMKRR